MPLVNASGLLDAHLQTVPAERWRAVARQCAARGFRQTLPYAERLACLRRARNELLLLQRADAALGAACVRVRSAPLPGVGLAFISGGPLLLGDPEGDDSTATLMAFVRALADEYVHQRGLAFRLSLPVADAARNVRFAEALRSLGLQASERDDSYRTILVDLGPEAAAIRRNLAQKWRNQLNAADRRSLQIDFLQSADAMQRFAPLDLAMRRRKSFTTDLGPDFYDQVQRSAPEDERLLVAIARHDGEDLGGAVVDLGGEVATYILGATTEAGMKEKAAYALHWAIMMEAKARGCRWYDLGGVDPKANPGVYHFKSGFGGTDTTVPGPFELRPAGWRGWVGRSAEAIYRRRRQWQSLQQERRRV